ncbi:MAG TPA: polysaccharide biosynthesis tyrosine autokinase [Azospirillum sp.]|nr:polysaccharide biosynthesis tyrosine autokinase [Azospirillum sp.]
MDQVEIVPAGARETVPRVIQNGDSGTGEVDAMTALKRHRFLIASLVIAVTLIAFLITRLMTPLYEAEAGVMFNPREVALIGTTTQQGTLLPSEETARKNEIAIVRSRSLAEAVVDRLALDRLPEFNPMLRPPSPLKTFIAQNRAALADWAAPVLSMLPPELAASIRGTPMGEMTPDRVRNEIIDAFLRRLETTSSDASRVIGIRFLSEDRERAAVVANTVADYFIARKREQEISTADTLARNLTQEIADVNREIQEAERKLDETRIKLGVQSDSNTKALADRMAELNRQLLVVTGERLRAEAQFAEARSARGTGDASAAQVLNSLLIQRLQEAAAAASARVGQLSQRYNESHPRLIEARSELRDIRAKIAEEMARIQNSRHNAVAIAQTNEEGLRRQIAQLKEQIDRANLVEVDIRATEREIEGKRTLLPQLVTRLNNANAQVDYLTHHGPETQVISRAVVPRFASHPPVLAIMATAVVLATASGGILAVLLERADNTIQSTGQIRRLTPLPVIGTLPVVRGRRWRRKPPAEQLLERSDTAFVEHLRTVALRAGACGQVSAKVLLFTSSVSNEGKSSAAASMARMLALSGRRTIIIDADLRAPTVHRALGMRRGPGLAELIEEGRDLADVMQRDAASGADVITAGKRRGASADILQSPRMQELIGELAIHYDTVIVDSPPVLAVCDAHILARMADRTLMMVRWRSTQASTLITALQRLADDRVPVDGIVLSQVDGKKYSHYGYADSEMFSPGFRKYYTH